MFLIRWRASSYESGRRKQKDRLTDWNNRSNAELYVLILQTYVIDTFKIIFKRVDHRSYKRQGQMNTNHIWTKCCALERIPTEKGDINRN